MGHGNDPSRHHQPQHHHDPQYHRVMCSTSLMFLLLMTPMILSSAYFNLLLDTSCEGKKGALNHSNPWWEESSHEFQNEPDDHHSATIPIIIAIIVAVRRYKTCRRMDSFDSFSPPVSEGLKSEEQLISEWWTLWTLRTKYSSSYYWTSPLSSFSHISYSCLL